MVGGGICPNCLAHTEMLYLSPIRIIYFYFYFLSQAPPSSTHTILPPSISSSRQPDELGASLHLSACHMKLVLVASPKIFFEDRAGTDLSCLTDLSGFLFLSLLLFTFPGLLYGPLPSDHGLQRLLDGPPIYLLVLEEASKMLNNGWRRSKATD